MHEADSCGDGKVPVEYRFEQETLWLPQATMANLYDFLQDTLNEQVYLTSSLFIKNIALI
ncbi:hypothetical protein [Serratia sp. DD3]|uniref:hypothetical protein n=1 Tax=Serratia sp. DD3 TaxID=1410619 RepID=UPI00041903E0